MASQSPTPKSQPPNPTTALLTPPGRGAVATIVYDGPVQFIDAAGLFRAARGGRLETQPLDRSIFGHWGPPPGEEVVLCRTAPATLEIHCHGGDAASAAIRESLANLGCDEISCWNYIERTRGLFERHMAEALAHAATPRSAGIIAQQADGPLRESLATIADEALGPDELERRLDALLDWADFGRHLTEPWQVVLFGRPNAGKSSLMNALAGFERAIVLETPGTTRDLVTVELALEGWPIRLTDTAGIRSSADKLETAGIGRAQAALAEADLRLEVLDRSEPPAPEGPASSKTAECEILVANKIDLPDAWQEALPRHALALSAKTGEGLEALTAAIVERLVPSPPPPDQPVPVWPAQIGRLESVRAALASGDFLTARRECRSLAR